MIDNMTSKNIYLSSWDILYMYLYYFKHIKCVKYIYSYTCNDIKYIYTSYISYTIMYGA
jgi:hypothetical protein